MTFFIFLLENWEKRSDKTTDWSVKKPQNVKPKNVKVAVLDFVF